MANSKLKPTIEEIKEQVTICENHYGNLFNKFRVDEEFYELEFGPRIDIPIEYAAEKIVLPTARDMVDAFVDHIDISHARVHANKKSTSIISEDEAEMLRKFWLGLIHRVNVESDISPWRVAAKHYALHGLAILKTVWDADNWIDKPKKNDGESDIDYAERIDEWRNETHVSIPIIIQAINPANVMPDPGYGSRLYVIEKRRKTLYEVYRKWKHWSNPNGRSADTVVDQITFWDKDYRTELVDGEPVLRVKGGVAKHDYGFIPYTFLESGLGNMSQDGAPEKRYVGILRYMYDLLVSESRNYSLNDVVLQRTALPWGVIEGENTNAVTEIKQKFGTYTPLPEGVKLVDMVPQTPPDALRVHLAITADYIAAHAAPRVVRGLGEEGVRSGADRRLVIAEASARYQYSKDSFSNGAANVLVKCARLFKNVIPGDMRVWARTPTDEFDIEIKKDKMKEPFTCYVEFAPISEEDEYRRHDDLERLMQTGIITRHWARTQMANVDPKAMELDEEREKLSNDPNVQAVVSQYAVAKLTEALQKRMGAESINPLGGMPALPATMSPEAPGNPMGGMVPPITNRAPLGSAQNLQNQLGKMRSQTPMNPGQGKGGGGAR